MARGKAEASHPPSRQTPYALPQRSPPVYSLANELPLRPLTGSNQTFRRVLPSQTLLPETSYSSSDGPPTPDSNVANSPQHSPYPLHRSPIFDSQQYPLFSVDESCSDNTGGLVFIDQDRTADLFDYPSPQFTAWSDQAQALPLLTPVESNSSSLAGIEASAETDSFVRDHVEFSNGPSPTRLQRLPQTYGPWAPYTLRQDELMNIDTESSPSSHNSALSPASSFGRAKRVGPLTQEGRRNANKVRDRGACIRCSCMKEKCDDGERCHRCDNKKGRKWKLGCVRERLDQRVHLFFPPPIAERYDKTQTNKYINGAGFQYLQHRPHFTLRLTMGVGGPPLDIPVREVDDYEQKRILHAFQINLESGSIDTRSTWDPPIVPYLTNKTSFGKNLFNQLGRSIQSVFDRKYDGGYYWPWRCFEDMSCEWVGEVAEKIHEFHHNAATIDFFKPIRTAHTALYFNYILDHPFMVKEEADKQHLFAKLEHAPEAARQQEWISPETVQRYLKATVFPHIQKITQELLAKLHQNLLSMARARPKNESVGGSHAQRDLAFSLSFMLLIIIGQTQSRLLMLSDLSRTDQGIDSLPIAEAQKYIDEIEESLANYITYFHEFATKKRQRNRKPDTPISPIETHKEEEAYSANFQLLKKVEEITRGYRMSKSTDYPVTQHHVLTAHHYTSRPCLSILSSSCQVRQEANGLQLNYLEEDESSFSLHPLDARLHRADAKMEDSYTETLLRSHIDNDRPSDFNRPPLDTSQFDKGNVHRLCWKFVETIFGNSE